MTHAKTLGAFVMYSGLALGCTKGGGAAGSLTGGVADAAGKRLQLNKKLLPVLRLHRAHERVIGGA